MKALVLALMVLGFSGCAGVKYYVDCEHAGSVDGKEVMKGCKKL